MNSTAVYYVVELEIHPGKEQAFREVAAAMTQGVAAERGAIAYEWYIGSDGRNCRLLETYVDNDAVRAHNSGTVVKQLVPKLIEHSNITRFEVYGEVDSEIAASMQAFGAVIYSHIDGLDRVRSAAA